MQKIVLGSVPLNLSEMIGLLGPNMLHLFVFLADFYPKLFRHFPVEDARKSEELVLWPSRSYVTGPDKYEPSPTPTKYQQILIHSHTYLFIAAE